MFFKDALPARTKGMHFMNMPGKDKKKLE
jgi:hypothetical protein